MFSKTKLMTLAVALIMAVVVVPAFASDDSSAATGSAGEMKLYVMDANYSWSSETVEAYNAALAVEGSAYFTTGDSLVEYAYTYWYDDVEYTDISSDYGMIETFMGLSDSGTDTWNVLVYDGSDWATGDIALGWYKPFEDWTVGNGAYLTANVALWYGDATDDPLVEDVEDSLAYFVDESEPTISLTAITKNDSVFKHTFYLKDYIGTGALDGQYKYSELLGVVVVGYGSDASLALIDAIGTGPGGVVFNNVYDTPVPGYEGYSWMDTLMGVGTIDLGNDTWVYWTLNEGHPSAPVYASFNIGAYSALTNAPLQILNGTSQAMTLIYDEYSF